MRLKLLCDLKSTVRDQARSWQL